MEYLISGYISVRSVIESKSRPIYKILIDKERYGSVMRSNYCQTEKRQYAALKKSLIDIEYVSAEQFKSICNASTAGGIAAYVGDRIYTPLSELLCAEQNGYITVLDGIEDPYNFGYVLRTLYAAGVDGIVLPKRNFFDSTDIVCRSSAGASELMKIAVADDLYCAVKSAKDAGYFIASTAKTDKAKDMYHTRVKRPLCLVIGGEKRGIAGDILNISDAVIKIKYYRNCPFSLSASSAASIISFEVAHRLSRSDK